MSTYKSKALLDTLVSDLRLRLPTLVANGLTVAFDANGDPYLILGTNTTGTQSALIRIKSVVGFGTDVLGTAAKVFTPHILQLCLETSLTAATSYLTAANMLQIMGETLKFGIQVDVYLTANATMPTASAPGTLTSSFSPHIQYGQMSSI